MGGPIRIVLAIATLGLIVARTVVAGDFEPWAATFDIVRPQAAAGHRLLTLGDLVGPAAEPERLGFPEVRAVLMVRVTPEDCLRPEGLCDAIDRELRSLDPRRVVVVYVVVDPRALERRMRAELTGRVRGTAVALDLRGVAARVVGLEQRGSALAVLSDGRRIAFDLERAERVQGLAGRIASEVHGAGGEGRGPRSAAALSQ